MSNDFVIYFNCKTLLKSDWEDNWILYFHQMGQFYICLKSIHSNNASGNSRSSTNSRLILSFNFKLYASFDHCFLFFLFISIDCVLCVKQSFYLNHCFFLSSTANHPLIEKWKPFVFSDANKKTTTTTTARWNCIKKKAKMVQNWGFNSILRCFAITIAIAVVIVIVFLMIT